MVAAEAWSPRWRHEQLVSLYREWKDCTRCRLCDTRTHVVFGDGPPTADIMLIGEGPGENEDLLGEAFVGESGKLLNAILSAAQIPREGLFITNLVMCHPPENRVPMRDEKASCYERLYKQIYTIDPMLIIPVGAEAMQALMGGAWKSITRDHGRFGYIEVKGAVEDTIRYPAMPVLHPSFINREDKINRETKNWEQGGWAHKTYKDFVRARIRVEKLKDLYQSAQIGAQPKPSRQQRLKVMS